MVRVEVWFGLRNTGGKATQEAAMKAKQEDTGGFKQEATMQAAKEDATTRTTLLFH